MTRWGAIVAGLLALVCGTAGCIDSEVTVCASGRICPPGSVCDDVLDRCVTDDQSDACAALEEGAACTFGGAAGLCRGGFCAPHACGDGMITGGEDCEPGDLAGADCTTLGYHFVDGLACDPVTCKFDDRGCTGECGDGARNGPEACDGADLDGKNCTHFGFYVPAGLTCNPASCTFDVSDCQEECGDNEVNGVEDCDGAPPTEVDCLDFGFDLGSIGCTNVCTPKTASCERFGWVPVNIGTAANLHSVWASGDDDVFVLGEDGTHHFDGLRWAPMTGGPTACGHRSEIWGRSASQVFAVTCDGLYTYDGASWTHEVTGQMLHGVGPLGADHVIAVGDDGAVLVHDGVSWTSREYGRTSPILDAGGTGPNDIWALESYELRRYNGAQWQLVQPPVGPSFGVLVALETIEDHVFVSVHAGLTAGYVLHFDGTQWTSSDVGFAVGISASSTERVVAAGIASMLRHYDGIRWRAPRADGGRELLGVYAAAGAASWAVGDGGTVLRMDAAYRTTPDAPTWIINDLWSPAGSDLVYAAGCDIEVLPAFPAVFVYDGDSWQRVFEDYSVDGCYTGVWGAAADDVYVVGDGVTARFDGVQWKEQLDVGGLDIWGWGANDVLVIGTESFRSNGSVWSQEFPGSDLLTAVWGLTSDDVYAVGYGGVIRHFDGASWSGVSSPTTAEIRVVWGTAADDVYIGTATGQLYRFNGTAWTLAVELPGMAIRGVAGTGADDVFVAGDDGVLLHFDGVAWRPVNSGVLGNVGGLVGGSRRIVGTSWDGGAFHLHRERFWHCPAVETACSDGIDNDCDGLVDAADADCP